MVNANREVNTMAFWAWNSSRAGKSIKKTYLSMYGTIWQSSAHHWLKMRNQWGMK